MKIRVFANAGRDEVFMRDGVLCVRVSSPAREGKANKKVIEVLEEYFCCKATIVSGQKSRDKEVAFADEAGAQEKIKELGKKS